MLGVNLEICFLLPLTINTTVPCKAYQAMSLRFIIYLTLKITLKNNIVVTSSTF